MSAPPIRPAAVDPLVRDAGRQPRSFADRLRLLFILLVLPATVVCVPIVVVAHFFGPHPPSKVPDTGLLQKSLQLSADQLLPTPPPLGPDAITVTVQPDHLAARMKKITEQAQAFGGTASEGLSTPTEKHLSVEVPAGRAEAFRQAVHANAAPGSFALPAGTTPAGKDFVDVVIRAAADDE